MLKAVLFDLDGVITDSAKYHFMAWKKIADELEIDFDSKYNEKLKGISRMESLDLILKNKRNTKNYTKKEKEKIAQRKNRYYQNLIKNMTSKDLLPGIKEFLEELKKREIKMVICSASKNANTIVDYLEIRSYFDVIVDASLVQNTKPSNDVFTIGAYLVGVNANEAIGIEDAKVGIEAIHRGGFKAVGVGTMDQMKDADLILKSTKELTYKEIENLV